MEGASVLEQLIGAVRSNNESILTNIFSGKSPEEVAHIINTSRDPVGSGLLHLAALNGSLDALYFLLDQEGTEIDAKDNLGNNTPLHLAVEFSRGPGNSEIGQQMVELLIECGAQPDLKNNMGKRPIDIAQTASLESIVNALRGAQYAAEMTRDSGQGGGGFDGVDGGENEIDLGEPTDEDEMGA